MMPWGADTAPFGASESDGLSPACCRPLAGVVASVRPTGERLTPAVPGAGPVQAPLKRGLSPPSGGDWGFLASCRDHGEEQEQRNPPSRLRRATSLFKGGFERGGGPLRIPAPAFGGVLRGVRRAGPGGDPRGTAKNFEARNPLGRSDLRRFFILRGKFFEKFSERNRPIVRFHIQREMSEPLSRSPW